MLSIKPAHYLHRIALKIIANVTLMCKVTERKKYLFQEFPYIPLLYLQYKAVLGKSSEVQKFRNQISHLLCTLLYFQYLVVYLRRKQLILQQSINMADNQCQWSTEFVTHISKKYQLSMIHFFYMLFFDTLFFQRLRQSLFYESVSGIVSDARNNCNHIEYPCPPGGIPRSGNMNSQLNRKLTGSIRHTYIKCIIARIEVCISGLRSRSKCPDFIQSFQFIFKALLRIFVLIIRMGKLDKQVIVLSIQH